MESRRVAMKKYFRILFLLYFTFFTSGFSLLEEGGEARAIGDEFYSRLKAEDYTSALQLCDPKFFEATSQEDILKFLRILEKHLGKIMSYTEAEHELNPQSRTTGGTTVVLRYSIKRTLFDSQDTVSVYREEGGNAFRILGFHVDSAGLEPFVTEQMLLTNVN